MRATPRRPLVFVALALVLAAGPGCSLKRMAINSVANTLAESGDTFASDDDPELIRHAVPFSLKLLESLLAEVPRHRGLLLAACSGFTQYAYAFVDSDAERVKLDDYQQHLKLQERARNMYLRGRGYCLSSLELAYPGIRQKLESDPDTAVRLLKKEDVPLIYWTGAAWGKAVAISLDRPALAGDFSVVQALIRRALALDEAYNDGAVHEMMIAVESLPAELGGSRERAWAHYSRALDLSGGYSAGAYVSYALGVFLPEQKRAEFVETLNKALAVDVNVRPRLRLANILAQERAQYLLDHLDVLFLSDAGDTTP